MKNKRIKVDYLARVEGEGAITINIKNNVVADVKLNIFEPPRFFEAFLRGRNFSEVPDITARICGICPIAHQTSSAQAIEGAFDMRLGDQLKALRRLLYLGEWIESHALHIYMLHAPDFLGYEDAIQMAKDHPEAVRKALELKKVGNEIVNVIGGREIHPINIKVGGFYRVPRRGELTGLEENLRRALDIACDTVKLVAGFSFPDIEENYEFVALHHPDRYAIEEGRIVSSAGLNIPVCEYENHFNEEHIEHSNALHSRRAEFGNNYFVGPLARFSLNFDKLSPLSQSLAKEAGLGRECRNPFKSIVVRSVETVYACEEALRIINDYQEPDEPVLEVEPRASVGCGGTEAPRGLLYHSYRMDEHGDILDAKIIPPTAQNLRTIEKDLRHFVSKNIDLPKDKLTWQCEQAVRNYDPCISCATHFIKLDISRE